LKDKKHHIHFVLFVMLCKVVQTEMQPHQVSIQMEATLQATQELLVGFEYF